MKITSEVRSTPHKPNGNEMFSENTRFLYFHGFRCFSASTSNSFNLLHNGHGVLGDFTEDNVFAVEMRCCSRAQEELWTIRVRPTVCHRKNSWTSVFVVEVFVLKFLSVNGFPSSSITFGEITTLTHEAWNDSMETASFVTISILSSTQFREVFHRLWNIAIQVHTNTTSLFATDFNVEESRRHFDGLDSIETLNISDYM